MAYVGFNPQNIPVPPYYVNPPVPPYGMTIPMDVTGATIPPTPPTQPTDNETGVAIPHPYPPYPRPCPPPPAPPYGPHGKLPVDGFFINYEGLTTDTAQVTVNNLNRTIKVDVNKQGVDTTFVYKTVVPMACWEIDHNLNKFPSVTLTDWDDNLISADVKFIDKNKVIVTLSEPICGKAYLN